VSRDLLQKAKVEIPYLRGSISVTVQDRRIVRMDHK